MNSVLRSLPDNAGLTLKEISSYVGVSKATLEGRVRRGQIPKGILYKSNATWSNATPRLFWKAKFVRDNLELFS